MKVYIAERVYDYEGFTIIGVFSTEESAQSANDNDKWEDGKTMRGDSYEIESFEVTP